MMHLSDRQPNNPALLPQLVNMCLDFFGLYQDHRLTNRCEQLMNTHAYLHPDIARNRVMIRKEAAEFCGLSPATFRRLNETGRFPTPIRLSERRLGWRVSALIEWLDCREQGQEWKEFQGARAT